MPELPSGTVTFLFTDIEGSTALWERDRDAMTLAVHRQRELLRDAIEANGGALFKDVGDGALAAFPTASSAVAAALAAQRALLDADWSALGGLRVRMALHTGETAPDERGDYVAAPLNRLARVLATGHGGQILLTQVVQQLVRGALPPRVALVDLGEHRLRDLLDPERVYQLDHPDLPGQFPPLRSLDARPHNLPRQPTPFLGRQREVRDVVRLLRRPEVRLVTLTGPGGTGKTRLALQCGAELLDDFADGVFFVSLAPLTDPALVPASIAGALAIREEGERPLVDQLREFLGARQMLLLVDNFEHLEAAAPAIGELLEATSALKLLTTSRVPLRLRAEREYPVPRLELPERKPLPTPELLSQYEAVRLFIERAQAVQPDFAVDNENAPALAEICHRLDGLPLAIELAAARIRMFPPRAMLTRLEQRLPLLVGGARDLPERHRALRNTIAWSYDLLAADEQQVFRRLAVFAGGMTAEATEAVADPGGHVDFFGGLERLLQHSMLRQAVGAAGEPRFLMLETIRDFGLEQLEAAGEVEATRSRHAAVFLALAEEAAPALHGPRQLAWLDRLEAEHDNLRGALAWAVEREPETVLRLAAAMFRFWFYRGHLTEGRDWTERALAAGAAARTTAWVKALNCASAFAWGRADFASAAARAEEALALARSLGDRSGEGWALIHLGVVASAHGDPQRGVALAREAEALLLSVGDRAGMATAIYNQGVDAGLAGDDERQRMLFARALAESQATGDRIQASWTMSGLGHLELERGQLDRARELFEEAVATARELRFGLIEADARYGLAAIASEQGDPERAAPLLDEAETTYRAFGHGPYLAAGLNSLGYLALHLGDLARAQTLFAEALDLAREEGEPSAIAACLHSIGDALRECGDLGPASARYRDSLILAQDAHDLSLVADCLAGLAGLAAATGRHQAAARLFEAVRALRETVGEPGTRYEARRQRRDQEAVCAALGAEADAEAGAAGRSLSMEAAVREALALADAMAAVPKA